MFLSAVSNKPNESEKAGHLSVDLPRSELHRQKREERVEAVSELDLKEFLTPGSFGKDVKNIRPRVQFSDRMPPD